MKRALALAVASLLASAPAFAAKDPCKGVSQKQDAFGVTRSFNVGDFKLKANGDKYTITVKFASGGGFGVFSNVSFDSLPAGSKVEFALADGTLVETASAAPANTQTANILGAVVQYYDIPLVLDADTFRQLTSQPIKGARLYKGEDAAFSLEVKESDAKKFQETGACIVSTSV